MDSKAEWCKALGPRIENIKGNGNCLYTSLGKALEMNGNQLRDNIVNKKTPNICTGAISWSSI
eukprot:6230037-Heterocapsa_arctica.AAC.1